MQMHCNSFSRRRGY